jgi:hypothetical protein
LTSEQIGASKNAYTRIRIDPATKASATGAHLVVESPFRIGEEARFIGVLAARLDASEANALATWVGKALRLLPAIGGYKTSGFGRVISAGIQEVEGDDTSKAADPSSRAFDKIVQLGQAEVRLEFDQPFLVSSDRWLGNSFRGSPAVPGSVLKAVLAETIEASEGELQAALSNVVVRELRPSSRDGARPRVVPLSSYLVGNDDRPEDALLSGDPEDWADQGEEIAFTPDWKPALRQHIASLYGHSAIDDYEIRTRTAVRPDGVVDEGRLFSYAAVKPGDLVWKGLLLRGTATPDQFRNLLEALPHSLRGIGKTKASARLSVNAAEKHDITLPSPTCFVLETDAAMHTPASATSHSDMVNHADRLKRQYEDYFSAAINAHRGGLDEIEPSQIDIQLFASQRRAGGYLAMRFPPIDGEYRPWILTQAGSVFRLTLPDSHRHIVAHFVEHGLPPHPGLSAGRHDWRGNPFVPENGYGEIRLLPDHDHA